MINIHSTRGRYVLKATVPSDTEIIRYEVSVANTVVFVGQSRYFGGDYEVDCSDWIDSYLSKATVEVTSLKVSIDFTYILEDETTQTQTKTLYYYPDVLYLTAPSTTTSDTYCVLTLLNSGFSFELGGAIKVPLMLRGKTLVGKTINNLEKVTWTDRYGDVHNGSLTNKYELECFIDPCWLSVKTNSDLEFEKVQLALQNSRKTMLIACGAGGYENILISGMDTSFTAVMPSPVPDPAKFEMECRVKDVKKVETYSAYSQNKKVPTYRITLEIYQ